MKLVFSYLLITIALSTNYSILTQKVFEILNDVRQYPSSYLPIIQKELDKLIFTQVPFGNVVCKNYPGFDSATMDENDCTSNGGIVYTITEQTLAPWNDAIQDLDLM